MHVYIVETQSTTTRSAVSAQECSTAQTTAEGTRHNMHWPISHEKRQQRSRSSFPEIKLERVHFSRVFHASAVNCGVNIGRTASGLVSDKAVEGCSRNFDVSTQRAVLACSATCSLLASGEKEIHDSSSYRKLPVLPKQEMLTQLSAW
jgi:hypothetical protein